MSGLLEAIGAPPPTGLYRFYRDGIMLHDENLQWEREYLFLMPHKVEGRLAWQIELSETNSHYGIEDDDDPAENLIPGFVNVVGENLSPLAVAHRVAGALRPHEDFLAASADEPPVGEELIDGNAYTARRMLDAYLTWCTIIRDADGIDDALRLYDRYAIDQRPSKL